MNKQFLQNSIISLSLFSFGLLLAACDQTHLSSENNSADNDQQTISTTLDTQQQRTSGKLLDIVQDIANLQLKAGNYIEQLQQTQQQLKDAVNMQDSITLQTTAEQLQTQLHQLNQTLNVLDLKSQEINEIRQKMMIANQQILASPFLNGQIHLTQVDFKKLEQQINSVQTEMLKLAALLLSEQTPHTDTSIEDA
ncbi:MULTISPECIES: hypothetical protein [unclassified Acinetobacter]|uniref:hypothetical protein n=1 Tax=unclassified Acinetobacter TaxID=196816 RepID=UPI002934B20D|nr:MULTISPECIES: hypothetical protein [unclassified Acinetobacter]WOE30715.1 hypothetical protein QSG84_10085 [Acinetobacter sp. SAAs470]WOE38908.1 hypothetical protein QSG86_03750 [Acinetobacter sp. SAAs474]